MYEKFCLKSFSKNTINYKGIHDNVLLERLHQTKQKLKDADVKIFSHQYNKCEFN